MRKMIVLLLLITAAVPSLGSAQESADPLAPYCLFVTYFLPTTYHFGRCFSTVAERDLWIQAASRYSGEWLCMHLTLPELQRQYGYILFAPPSRGPMVSPAMWAP